MLLQPTRRSIIFRNPSRRAAEAIARDLAFLAALRGLAGAPGRAVHPGALAAAAAPGGAEAGGGAGRGRAEATKLLPAWHRGRDCPVRMVEAGGGDTSVNFTANKTSRRQKHFFMPSFFFKLPSSCPTNQLRAVRFVQTAAFLQNTTQR